MTVSSDTIIQANGLTKRFGGFLATDDLSFELRKNEIHAVIGPNGAGKSTFIKQIAGEVRPDSGTILFTERNITNEPASIRAGIGISRSFQVSSVLPTFTVLENVLMAIQAVRGHSFKFWKPFGKDKDMIARAMLALERVRLAHKSAVEAQELGYGATRQLELAMVISTDATVLLLDEPLAGMGTAESDLVIELIESFRGKFSVLLVEHDMRAVFALADRITVLARGRVLAVGKPEDIRSNREVRNSYLGESA
jgi:branched-chain amino acid transport system ATP-binding protein